MQKQSMSLDRRRRIHCINRAYQRFKLYLSESDIDIITQLIQDNQASLIFQEDDNERSYWSVEYRNTTIYVVYDHINTIIRTILTAELLLGQITKKGYVPFYGCNIEGCSKRAYPEHEYMCREHYLQISQMQIAG